MKRKSDLELIMAQLEDIMLKKHADYGPMNISGAPGGAMNGLRVRMYDKLARLNNLVDTGDTPNYESIEDTLIDLANYAIIGLLVQRGQWEGLPNSNGSETETSSSTQRPANSISKQFSSSGNPRLYPRLQT
jgi:hypothetical protein